MAGQPIVAAIGVVCILLFFLTDPGDMVSRSGLLVSGIILIAYAAYSYFAANYHGGGGNRPQNAPKEPGYLVNIDDFVDRD
jgi:hypothetical protein